MKKFIPVLLLSLALLPAAAAEQGEIKVSCDDPQTQYEINVCAQRQFKAADAELNRAYNQLASKLEGGAREKLKAAELSWLKYRDDNCEYETFLYAGGTMRPAVYSSCLERMTKARTAELRGQLEELNQ
jgi:uncharacterized protein YecT (DUF1311 family)